MRKCMYIGYGLRVLICIVFPVGLVIDLFTGVITVITISPLREVLPREGFLIAFIGTFIQGALMNCVVSIVILIIWFVPWWNSKHQAESATTLCGECLYDLKRVPENAPCPECGTHRPEPEPTNTSCFSCGYNLKETAEGSACPECGSTEGVGDLFDSTPLSRTPSWVFQLWSTGILLVTAAILAMNIYGVSIT